MNDITIRFLECYDWLKEVKKVFTPKGFANEIGVSTSLITEICKKRTNAGITPIQNLIIKYPEFNANWLLTGIGDKLISDETNKTTINEDHIYIIELQKEKIRFLENELEKLKKEKSLDDTIMYVAEPREELKKELKQHK